MELNDKEVLLVSLRHVAQANGIIEIDSLDESSNPTLDTMNRILHSVGLRLSVTELHA
ncbi:putative addiction module antidote protein [Polynucleobacter sp. 78F-HAINBA]|nr:putative addiction module antidote protein [Polynucleobacter sp. 78F-HAINBA]